MAKLLRIGRELLSWAAVILLAGGLVWIYTAGREIPQAVEFHQGDPEREPLLVEELASLQEENINPFTCISSKLAAVHTPSGRSETVIAVYTDPVYPRIYPLRWSAGHFWFGREGAVISEQTAEELFDTREALGALLQMDGGSLASIAPSQLAGASGRSGYSFPLSRRCR